jgi:uncharacterized repeat protein (TIGR01451 family)
MAGKRLTKLGLAGGAVLALAALLPATALAPADLSITKSDSPDPVTEGQQLTYTIEVRNDGPDPATNVLVSDDLSTSDFDLVSTAPSQGNCTTKGGQKVSCELGTVLSGATATVTIVVTTKKAGIVTNTASVTSDEPDPQTANNTATANTTVLEAPKPPGKPPKGGSCKTAVPTIIGTEGNDTLVGTEGADVIFGLGGDDTITGLGGKDLICAGAGNDTAKGQADADFVRGGGGKDRTKGGGANDKVGGGAGRDRLGGGRGADFLNGGRGKDRCNGGPGKDTFRSC